MKKYYLQKQCENCHQKFTYYYTEKKRKYCSKICSNMDRREKSNISLSSKEERLMWQNFWKVELQRLKSKVLPVFATEGEMRKYNHCRDKHYVYDRFISRFAK